MLTERLDLVPTTPALLRAALEGPRALEAALGARMPETWPPEFLDAAAIQYLLDRLAEETGWEAWGGCFAVLRGEQGSRTLIGMGGYKGPPTADGTVEVGYGIVSDHRLRGYASEVTRALVRRALDVPEVQRVIAETLPELAGSIGVLRRCGFRLTGEGSEPGVIRYELTRAEYCATGAGHANPETIP